MTGDIPELSTTRDVEAIVMPILDTPRERSRATNRPSRRRMPIPENSLEALQARHDARHVMPRPDLVTKVEVYEATKDSPLLRTIDFSSLARRFPKHDALIRQLIVGMNAIFATTILPSRSFVVHRENAITDFITFLYDAAWPPQNRTHILRVSDVSVDTATSYAMWLEARHPGRTTNHVLYNDLKRIITNLRADYPNDPAIGRQLIWPIGPAPSSKPLEPYPMHVLEDIKNCAKADIVETKRRRHDFDNLQARGEVLGTGASIPGKTTRMDDVTAKRLWGLGVATVAQAYPGFPFSMSVPDALARCTIGSANAAFPAGSIERKLARLFEHPDIGGWHSFLGSMSFTAETLFPFHLLVLIESRFNRESVAAIPGSFALDDHVADIPIDCRTDDYLASRIRTIVEPYPFQPDRAVLIASTKVRGRGKTVYCKSSVDNPFDIHALMRYVVSRNRRVISNPHYIAGALWQYARHPGHWSKEGMTGVLNLMLLQREGQRFIKRHGLDQRHGLSSIDSRRVRVSATVEAYVREVTKQGIGADSSLSSPEERVALDQQNDLKTTTTHYLSNGVVAEAKNRQLEPIQQMLFQLARGDHPQLSFKSWEQLRDDIRCGRDLAAMRRTSGDTSLPPESSEKTDMYILSPDGLTYILVCSDPLAPTWPGHEQFVPAGTRCCYFNRCGQCARAIVFRENLPYIARRILDIEELQADIDPIAWTMQYADECQSWHDILGQWAEREPSDVEDAWRQARAGSILLPTCMRGPRGNGQEA